MLAGLCTSRQPGQRFASLRAIRDALALPVPPDHSRNELRTAAIAALCLPDLELAYERGHETVGSRGFTIDSAFERYAVADKDVKITIRRLSDDTRNCCNCPVAAWRDEYTRSCDSVQTPVSCTSVVKSREGSVSSVEFKQFATQGGARR